MKPVFFIGIWLGGCILWLYVYLGLGSDARQREGFSPVLMRAGEALETNDYGTAVDLYEEAAAGMPDSYSEEQVQLRIHAARAKALDGSLLEAIDTMNDVLFEMPALMRRGRIGRDLRETMARNQYYAAWIMRLEGAPRHDWIVFADQSRQQYRILAETAGDSDTGGDPAKNLESAVRLTRMDLATLRSLPLPPEAQRARERGVGKGEGEGKEGKGKAEGPGKGKPNDARGTQPGAGVRPELFGS